MCYVIFGNIFLLTIFFAEVGFEPTTSGLQVKCSTIKIIKTKTISDLNLTELHKTITESSNPSLQDHEDNGLIYFTNTIFKSSVYLKVFCISQLFESVKTPPLTPLCRYWFLLYFRNTFNKCRYSTIREHGELWL